MAKSYRTRSTKGVGGTRKYTTQSSSGGVSNTMSYKTGTGQRTAITRKANGSVVQTKTHRRSDGFVTRERKTVVSAYKPPKTPKPPKMPKLKTSIVKEAKPVKLKPYKAPKTKTVKSKPFKWPTYKSSSSRTRVRKTSDLSSAFVKPFLIFLVLFTIFALIFG